MSATDLHFFLQFKYIPLAANVFVYEHNIHSNRKLEFLALQAFVFVHFFFSKRKGFCGCVNLWLTTRSTQVL